MSNADPFAIVEQPIPVPDGVASVDIVAEYEKLLVRCSKLEDQVEAGQTEVARVQRQLLAGFLEIVDALDRILDRPANTRDPARDAERQRSSVESTRRLLNQKLSQAGVVPLDLIGRVVEPTVADVEAEEEHSSLPDETIVREAVRGYLWHGEVLRRARVIVAVQP